ncbi:hypothetical protein ACNFBT_11675 [Pseudomonas sp. NY15181]|uniref:hypothetical protein n=1 Tax=Pseudomonas sp. NY15181 TaxID=3400349 RepID=UPI003A8646EC
MGDFLIVVLLPGAPRRGEQFVQSGALPERWPSLRTTISSGVFMHKLNVGIRRIHFSNAQARRSALRILGQNP